jgi:hypothetical protein
MNLTIEFYPPVKLQPYDKNAKPHSPEQLEELKKSIELYGFDQPIVVDINLVIIKGHGRRQAAIELGLKEVPVIVADHLSNEAARLSRLIDNDSVGMEWDSLMLKEDLDDLIAKGGSVEMACVSEEEFNRLVSASSDTMVSLSDFVVKGITTKYDCPKCGYRW